MKSFQTNRWKFGNDYKYKNHGNNTLKVSRNNQNNELIFLLFGERLWCHTHMDDFLFCWQICWFLLTKLQILWDVKANRYKN